MAHPQGRPFNPGRGQIFFASSGFLSSIEPFPLLGITVTASCYDERHRHLEVFASPRRLSAPRKERTGRTIHTYPALARPGRNRIQTRPDTPFLTETIHNGKASTEEGLEKTNKPQLPTFIDISSRTTKALPAIDGPGHPIELAPTHSARRAQLTRDSDGHLGGSGPSDARARAHRGDAPQFISSLAHGWMGNAMPVR